MPYPLTLADLECLPWSTMDMYSEPNEALSYLYSLFKSVLDSHAPLKKRRVKREFIPEWFNSEIQAAIATRNHLHRKAILTNDALNWREYRSARNRVVHLIRYAKRSFYRNSIKNNLENPKNLWRIIRFLAPSKLASSSYLLTRLLGWTTLVAIF